MTIELFTLAAAVIAFLGSVLSLFISSTLAIRKERRQLLWSKELDRFFELEEFAGTLVEELGSYKPVADDRTELGELFDRLDRAAGRFGRYPDVRQAIRDLGNTLAGMFAANRADEDDREIRKELQPAYQALLQACDAVVGRKGVGGNIAT